MPTATAPLAAVNAALGRTRGSCAGAVANTAPLCACTLTLAAVSESGGACTDSDGVEDAVVEEDVAVAVVAA